MTITAPKGAPNAPYVQGLTVNGTAWDKPWTTYDKIANGGTIDFNLGTKPNTSWAQRLRPHHRRMVKVRDQHSPPSIRRASFCSLAHRPRPM